MSISLKQTHEIMEAIKRKNINKAITYLEKVLDKKDFIPFKKYPSKGHKHGVPAGFPQKSTKQVIEILNELKANAKNIGAEADNLTVSGYDLGKGRFPRYRGGGIVHKGKRTNLRIFGSAEKSEKIEPIKEEKKKEETKTQEKAEITQAVNEAPKQEEEKPAEEKKDVTKENT